MTRFQIKTKKNTDIVALVKKVGGSVLKTWDPLPGCACIELPSVGTAALIRANPEVKDITEDMDVFIIPPIAVDATSSVGIGEYEQSWGVRAVFAPEVHATGNIGADVHVVIIDTGGDSDHADLITFDGINYETPGGKWEDDNGHGTHVHGIIAAQLGGSAANVVGVAPNAIIHHFKAFNSGGGASWSTVVDAVVGCIELAELYGGLIVANQSFGGTGNPGSVLETAYKTATEAGIFFVTSAGNGGPAPPGGDSTLYPAKFITNTCVGSTDEGGDNSSFSATGPSVEVMGPGGSVYSTTFDGGYGFKSGTSMAAPHITGLFVLCIAAGISDPRAVIPTSTDQTERTPERGWGVPDARKMVAGDQTPVYSKNVTFDPAPSFDVPPGKIMGMRWDFNAGGDNLFDYGMGVQKVTYALNGTYDVALEVTDNGTPPKTDLTVKTITVFEEEPPPENDPPVAGFIVTDGHG